MKAIAILTTMLFTLSACVTEQDRQGIANLSDYDLCVRWMDRADVNIYNSTFEDVISRRELNCDLYGNVAARKAAANERGRYRSSTSGQSSSQNSSGAVSAPQRRPISTRYLTRQEPIIGGNLCHYSDGSTDRMGAGRCPVSI